MSKAEIDNKIRIYVSKLFAHMVEDLEDENGIIKSKDVEDWTCSTNVQEIITRIPNQARKDVEEKKNVILSSLIKNIKKDVQEAINVDKTKTYWKPVTPCSYVPKTYELIKPEEEPKKKRRRGRPKKKEGEKGVCSAYMFFCKEERKRLKKEYPLLERKEIMTRIGLEWKSIKDTEVGKKYYEMSNQDRLSKMK